MWFFDFMRISYSYVGPRGLWGHLNFILDAPFVAIRYRQIMKQYQKGLEK